MQKWYDKSMKIFPNPSKGEFFIEFAKTDGFKSLKIFDIRGKQVFQKLLRNSKEAIDLSNFGGGIYLLQFQYKDELIHAKIIIQEWPVE
jgi:hypothetical protein